MDLFTCTLAVYPTFPVGYLSPAARAGEVYASEMSIPVAIDDLVTATAERGWAYLLTVRDDLRPHIVAVDPVWDGEQMVIAVGKGTAHGVSQRPLISLCYPPVEDGGYSLIVDGDGAVDGDGTDGEPSVRFGHGMRQRLRAGRHTGGLSTDRLAVGDQAPMWVVCVTSTTITTR